MLDCMKIVLCASPLGEEEHETHFPPATCCSRIAVMDQQVEERK